MQKVDIKQLQQFIEETYGADAEHPWANYPNYTVFRHRNNQKWFALMMDISKDKLGLPEKDPIHVLNVKCDPLMIGSLRSEAGIYPAYHMSKTSWITVALDGSVNDEKIKWLLDMSFDLTAKVVKAKRKGERRKISPNRIQTAIDK